MIGSRLVLQGLILMGIVMTSLRILLIRVCYGEVSVHSLCEQ